MTTVERISAELFTVLNGGAAMNAQVKNYVRALSAALESTPKERPSNTKDLLEALNIKLNEINGQHSDNPQAQSKLIESLSSLMQLLMTDTSKPQDNPIARLVRACEHMIALKAIKGKIDTSAATRDEIFEYQSSKDLAWEEMAAAAAYFRAPVEKDSLL